MNLSLTIASGPSRGSVVAIDEDEMAEIGSGGQADVIVSDPAMNHLHFAIECGDTGCEVRDLNSHHGTFVNRRRVKRYELEDGDEIEAGQTRLRVRIWQRREASPVSVSELPTERGADGATGILQVVDTPVHAILDAARSARIPEMLREYQDGRWRSLYEGKQAIDLADYCPYLVSFSRESGFLADIMGAGWGHSWGVFLSSDADFDEIRRHFRHFLLVPDATGAEMYFGFYDPRVLRPFLGSCSPVQARHFFGPIRGFFCESADRQALLTYELSQRLLRRGRLQPSVG